MCLKKRMEGKGRKGVVIGECEEGHPWLRLKSYLVRWGLCARCQKAIGTPFDITALHFC